MEHNKPFIFFMWPAHTVRNLHFLSKNSTLISRENCQFFGVKKSRNCCGFGLLSCWQLWFHEKNCPKQFWVKNSWKCWGFVKIEFLDKNLTFRIVHRMCLTEFLSEFRKCFNFFHKLLSLLPKDDNFIQHTFQILLLFSFDSTQCDISFSKES